MRLIPSNPLLRGIIIALLGVVALAAWGLSSPAGSSPDDDFHLSSIWCAQGESAGMCENITETSVQVPDAVAHAPCFAYNDKVTAACQLNLTANLVNVSHVNNVDHTYPGGFYWVMSLFTSSNVTLSVQLMRLFNVLLFVGISAATFLLIKPKWRAPLSIAVALSVVPLGMFFIASTNPSSWMLYSPAYLFVLTRTLVSEQRPLHRWLLVALMLLITAIACSARADAAFFAVVAVGLALVAEWGGWWRNAWVYIAGAGVTVIAGLSILAGRQADAAMGGLGDSTTRAARTSLGLLIRNILELPGLYTGVSGTWGLGWLDTTMPAVVWVGMVTLIGGVVYSAISFKERREFLVPLLAGAVMVAVPLLVSQLSGAAIGAYVQPRYVLPLMALTLLALLSTSTQLVFETARPGQVAVAVLIVANAVALGTNAIRYAVGLQTAQLNPGSSSWDTLTSAIILTFVGAVAFGFLCEITLLSSSVFKPEDRLIGLPRNR